MPQVDTVPIIWTSCSAAVLAEGLKQVPDSAALLYFSGLQLIRGGDRAAAMARLQRASKVAPREAQYAYAYALALDAAGRLQEAAATLKTALEYSPYSPQLLQAAAQLAHKAGDDRQADDYQRRYAQVAPDPSPLL